VAGLEKIGEEMGTVWAHLLKMFVALENLGDRLALMEGNPLDLAGIQLEGDHIQIEELHCLEEEHKGQMEVPRELHDQGTGC